MSFRKERTEVGAPLWLQVSQLAATLALGAGAFFIAFQQWRAARDKLVLDLFDKRLRVYDALNQALRDVVAHEAQAATPLVHHQFLLAHLDAKYLYGKEVDEYLGRVSIALLDLHAAHALQNKHVVDEDKQDKHSCIEEVAFSVIERYYHQFPTLISDYVRMDHKLSRASLPRFLSFIRKQA